MVTDDVEGMLFREHMDGKENSKIRKGKELGKDGVSDEVQPWSDNP